MRNLTSLLFKQKKEKINITIVVVITLKWALLGKQKIFLDKLCNFWHNFTMEQETAIFVCGVERRDAAAWRFDNIERI